MRGYGSEIGVYILPQAAWWAIYVSPIAGRQTTALPQYEEDKDVPVALVAHSCAPSPWLCIIDGPPTTGALFLNNSAPRLGEKHFQKQRNPTHNSS